MSMLNIVAKINTNIDEQVRSATIGLFTGIRKMTPVDTGRARGNWQCTIGSPFVGENDNGSNSQIISTIPEHAGSVVYLSNNLPYISALEYGHSKQAPAGMVRVSIARFGGLLSGIS